MGEFLAKVDRVQKSLMFMRVATGVLILLGIGAFIALWLMRGPIDTTTGLEIQLSPDIKVEDGKYTAEEIAQFKSGIERFNKSLEVFTANRGDLTSSGVAIAAVAGLLILAVWLGLGLTILGLCVAGALVVLPLQYYEATRGWARLFGGLFALSIAFSVIMRGLNLLLSLPGAMFAIARNTVTEATRLKLSVIFIGVLLVGLAALPSLLDPETQLRYRVQSFLQYATGGTFWVVALLVVLFSVSTVATEQRDKVIWQTMTKPVAAWQYVLGKWIGVVALSGALLCVSGVGIFLFVEFLRNQPAENETGPYRSATGVISEDRRWLESQVLTARVSVQNESYELERRDPQLFEEQLDQYLAEAAKSNASFDPTDPAHRRDMAISLSKTLETNYRSLGPGGSEGYIFSGLAAARDRGLPIFLRWRVDSGANSPDKLLNVTFFFENYPPETKQTPLGQFQNLMLPPIVINDQGELRVRVFNGRYDATAAVPNADAVNFPKDGLEVSYSVGSYRLNFVRVMAALWVKLAFLSMAGIFAGTFLSFSVASMVAFLVLAMAESSTYLIKALVVYDEMDAQGNIVPLKWVVVNISRITSTIFKAYGDLQPTKRLVDGMLLSWSEVAVGVSVLTIFTAILFAAASAIFSKRELAIYSGQ